LTRQRINTKSTKKIELAAYAHPGVKRKNNPQVGLVNNATDPVGVSRSYQHDPHIDPYLSWAGKQEGQSFSVTDVSLHVHERIDPQRVVKSFLKEEEVSPQPSLFEMEDNKLSLNQAIDFYFHEQDWTNRLIAGDSLLVMNSLLNKEGMSGQVQMIYIDPPYGVKYNSNFQPFTNKNQVKDNNDADIPAEPEMIQAFRDTWELGIHSYLTHLHDRFLLAKDLLHSTGSIFVQISEENVHHVREVMDEIFGKDNFISLITFVKTSGFQASYLDSISDYIIWYGKDAKVTKYHQIFREKSEKDSNYRFVELPEGDRRQMTPEEFSGNVALPTGSKIYRLSDITSQGAAKEKQPFEFQNKVFYPGANGHWKANYPEGMEKLVMADRIQVAGNNLAYVRFAEDFPAKPVTNNWDDTNLGFGTDKIYVVQTNPKVIERCILMTTDPGDLVLDPTCGGGTTAWVAEKWGRRWITCDTSRVAVTLAKQRLMTAKFDYYQLAYPEEGIKSGFIYRKVPHITLGSIANDEPPQGEVLYDQPEKVKNAVRATGPFTVEAVPSLRVKPFDGQVPMVQGLGKTLAQSGVTGNEATWRDELKATGIRGVGGRMIQFSRVEPIKGTRYLHAYAEILEEDGINKKAVITFGPEYGPLEQRQVEEAINEARSLAEVPDFVIFAAFHFDPEASKDIDQVDWPGVKLLKAQMSVDLLTSDLRKKRSSSQSYWLIGQPDVEVVKIVADQYKVRVNGFDYYDPISGEIESKDNNHIAMWLLDTDYDERSLLPSQVFFPHSDNNRDWTKLAKALNGEVDEELLGYFVGVESSPFKLGSNRKIAVKIIDNRGIESLVIKKVE
jgi:adenine-specific DNA-methyltransferase